MRGIWIHTDVIEDLSGLRALSNESDQAHLPQRHSVRATGKLQAGSGERGPGTTAMTIAEFKDTFTTAAQLREVLGQPLLTSSAMDTDGSMFDW